MGKVVEVVILGVVEGLASAALPPKRVPSHRAGRIGIPAVTLGSLTTKAPNFSWFTCTTFAASNNNKITGHIGHIDPQLPFLNVPERCGPYKPSPEASLDSPHACLAPNLSGPSVPRGIKRNK
jgi:hypothetical protein